MHVLIYICVDFTVNHLQSYPIGVTLPILRLLFHCRAHPKSTWSLSAYSLIGNIHMYSIHIGMIV